MLCIIQNLYISNTIQSNAMSKEYTHIKANGIRNELKEIRKSVDKLTDAIKAHTNAYENLKYNAHSSDVLSGM